MPRTSVSTGRAAWIDQWDALRDSFGRIDDAQWAASAVTAGWRVGELVAHLGLGAASLVAAIAEPTAERPLTLGRFVATDEESAAAIDGRTREAVGGDRAAVLAWVDAQGVEARAAVEALDADPVVASRGRPIRASDYLATRCVELVVHADDLARSVPALDVPQRRSALQVAVRALADVLAERAPGHSVEVRIPPFAAVQCVAGPRHTRGTPPAAVETDPTTFLRLATGRTSWADAVASGAVRSSGVRADLAPYLPLLV